MVVGSLIFIPFLVRWWYRKISTITFGGLPPTSKLAMMKQMMALLFLVLLVLSLPFVLHNVVESEFSSHANGTHRDPRFPSVFY